MTGIEKKTIMAALSEYAYNHQKAAERAYRAKDYAKTSEERAHANIAAAILTYWPDVVNAPCGSVKI